MVTGGRERLKIHAMGAHMVIRDTLPIHTWHTHSQITRHLIKVNHEENEETCKVYLM